MNCLISKEQMEKIGSALMEAPYKHAQPAIELLLKLPILKESVGDAGTKEATPSDSGEKS